VAESLITSPWQGLKPGDHPLGTGLGLSSHLDYYYPYKPAFALAEPMQYHHPSFLEFRYNTISAHRRCHGSEEVAPACGPFVLPPAQGWHTLGDTFA